MYWNGDWMTAFDSLRKPLMILGIGLGALATYSYQVLIARVLGPEDFGLLAALLALLGVIGIVASGLSPIAAQSSFEENKSKRVWKFGQDQLFTTSLLATIALAGFFSFFAVFFGQPLRLGSVPLVLVACYIPLAAIFAIGVGRMQASNRLMEMTWLSAGSGMIKLLSIIPISLFALGATSAIALVNVVSLGAVALAMYATRNVNPGSAIFWDRKSINTLFLITLFWTLSNSDIVAVKVLATDKDAGLYAASSSLGRVSLILSTIYVQYRFHKLLKEYRQADNSFSAIYAVQAVFPVALLGLLLSGCFFIFGDKLVLVVYGPAYSGGSTFLFYQAFLATIISVNYVLLNISLIAEIRRIAPILSCITLLTIFAYLNSGDNAYVKLEILFFANITLALALVFNSWFSQRKIRSSL
jgi:O-antigen/teichoic acid export membrane protein